MSLRKPVLTALLLVSLTLAGCAGGEDEHPSGFTIVKTPADPVTEPFVFRATASGDSYEWDMGDGRALQTGKEVSYVYGFTDGTVKPKLIVIKDGERTPYPARTLTLGTGANQIPTFQMDLEWDWVSVGEEVTFSGAASSDPDGDPLLFNWFCIRQSDIGPAGAGHAHAGAGGLVYGAGGPDPIPTRILNGTNVPTADRNVGDDLCGALSSGGAFTENATVRGSFKQPGIYKITMLAKDPKTPSVPGSRLVYVTAASEPRVNNPVVVPFSGSFDYGVPSALDAAMAQAEQQDGYIANFPFQVKYPLTAFQLDFNYAAGGGANVVTYHIMKPNGSPKDTAEQSSDLDKGALYLDHGSGTYNLRVYGRQGADLSFDGEIRLFYETNPTLLFEDPTGH